MLVAEVSHRRRGVRYEGGHAPRQLDRYNPAIVKKTCGLISDNVQRTGELERSPESGIDQSRVAPESSLSARAVETSASTSSMVG